MKDARRLLIAICALAVLVRLGAFVALDRLHHPEYWETETVAMNLLQGKGFVYPFYGTIYRSYIEPLYPVLCALIYGLTHHSTMALALVHTLLGTVLVWLVFVCGRLLVSESVALVAALLAALHPGLILYTTKFHPFVLDSVLFLSVFSMCLIVATNVRWRCLVVLGLLTGLCLLSRPTIVACLPLMSWWVWTRSPVLGRTRLLRVGVVLACAALLSGIWVVRNYRIHQRFILTRSGTSLVFWLGNNPYRFTGSALDATGEPLINAIPEDLHRRLLALDELGQQDLLMVQAQRYVRDHPLAFLKRWGLKWWYFWWFSPQAGLLYPTRWFRVYQGFYAVILGFALVGTWGYRRDQTVAPGHRRGAWLLWGFCLSIALLQSLFYIEGRHRLAIEPVMLIFTSYGLWWTSARAAVKLPAVFALRSG